LEQKAFDLIASRTEKVLEPQGFKRQKELVEEEAGKSVLYIGENTAYSILYNEGEGKFDLRSTLMTDEGPDDSGWKSISSWIFNGESDTMKDAESIAADFCSTVDDSKRRAAIRAAKRKATRDDDNNPGPVFFFKRLVNVFPELRDEIAIERESYEDFRAVTFAKEKVLPKIEELGKKKGSAQLKKLGGFLNDFYKEGDLDVRAIITMVIFNGVSDEVRENLLTYMDASFQKYYKRCIKYKNKTVKPERVKKKNNLHGNHGEQSPERLSGKVPKEFRK
jgi:hypothetical protein